MGELSEIAAHVAGCRRCGERMKVFSGSGLGRLTGPLALVLPWRREIETGYGAAIAAAEQCFLIRAQALAAERAAAPARLAELLTHSAEQRLLLIRNHPGFQTWGLLERLIETARETTFQKPAAGEEIGRLALQLADLLDAGYYGTERIQDLRARLWGYVGNARRVTADLREAEEAFQTAFELLRTGTGDPLERALLIDLHASLRREQGRHGEALRLLARALRIYRKVGETHREGRVLVKMSTVHEHAGMPERAIPLLYEALRKIDAGREPRLLLGAQHNLITFLAEVGRPLEAQRLLIQVRPLYDRFADGWMRNRRRWVEGKIALGLGQVREAEACFVAAREAFIVDERVFEAAFVALELAALYAEQRRTAELARLAEETLPIFASRQSYPRAFAALALLHRVAADEQASRDATIRLMDCLKRFRDHSGLPLQLPVVNRDDQ
jgi:tetratricopeptide (TPR) repeat protein